MARPAALIIRKCSYLTGIIMGLLLFALGAFLAFHASATDSFRYF